MLTIRQLKFPLIAITVLIFSVAGLYIFRHIYKPRYNVVLIVADTLSAPHTSLYGYSRRTTPFLEQFAKESFVFKQSFSSSTYTFPSHMSIFTGINAFTHGMSVYDKDPHRLLPKKYATLPQILKSQGYNTAWFAVNNDFQLDLTRGLERGFDYFAHSDHEGILFDNARENWLKEHKDHPFFVFLHANVVHDPYIPPKPFYGVFNTRPTGHIIAEKTQFYKTLKEKFPNGEWVEDSNTDGLSLERHFFFAQANLKNEKDLQEIIALYDEEILYLDHLLSEWIEKLKSLSLYENTIIIITADHGEGFQEHGEMMHNTIHQEILRVPLLIRIPGMDPGESQQLAQNVDILPTILDFLRISLPDYIDGKSLLPIIRGSDQPVHDYIFAKKDRFGFASVQNKQWKLIRYPTNTVELYEISKDPLEKNNVAAQNQKIIDDLTTVMEKRQLERASISKDF